MEKQFIKVGETIFNVANITAIRLNGGEFSGDRINIKTVDCVEGHYSVKKASPEGKALLAWLTERMEVL